MRVEQTQRANASGRLVDRGHCPREVQLIDRHDELASGLPPEQLTIEPRGHGIGLRIVVRRAVGADFPPPATLRTDSLTTRISISSCTPHSRMSQSAASVSMDSRCGGWVTSRKTCSLDRCTPRSASGATKSEVANIPGLP